MQEYIERYDNGNETIDDSWNYLQTTLKCCGVDNYTNWENNQKFTNGTLLPESCCDKSSSCTTEATYNKYNTKGCLEEILRKYGIIQEIIEILIWDILGNSRKNIPNGKLFSPPVDKMGNLLMRIFEKIWDYSGKH